MVYYIEDLEGTEMSVSKRLATRVALPLIVLLVLSFASSIFSGPALTMAGLSMKSIFLIQMVSALIFLLSGALCIIHEAIVGLLFIPGYRVIKDPRSLVGMAVISGVELRDTVVSRARKMPLFKRENRCDRMRLRYQLGAVGDVEAAVEKARTRTSHRHSQTAASSSSGDSGDGDSDGGDGDGGDGDGSSDDPQPKKKKNKSYIVDPEKEKQFLAEQFERPELLIRLDIDHKKAYLVNLSGFFKNPCEFYEEIIQKTWYADHDLQIACRLTRHLRLQPGLFSPRHRHALDKIIADTRYAYHDVILGSLARPKIRLAQSAERDRIASGLFDYLVISKLADKHDFFTRPNPRIIEVLSSYIHNANQALLESGVGGDYDANELRRIGSENISDTEKEYLKHVKNSAFSMQSLHVISDDGSESDEKLLDLAAGSYYSYDHDYECLDHGTDNYDQLDQISSYPACIELKDCLAHAVLQPTHVPSRGVGASAVLHSLDDKGYFNTFDNVRFFLETVKSGFLKELCAEYDIEQKAKTNSDFAKNLRAAAIRFAQKDEKVSKIVLLALEYGAGRIDTDSLLQVLEAFFVPAAEIVVDWGVSDEEARRIEKEAGESIQSFVDSLVDALLEDTPQVNAAALVDAPANVAFAGVSAAMEADTHPAESVVAPVEPVEPPFVWMGGKRKMAQKINEIMPPPSGSQAYIEPFAGGLAVLLSRKPAGIEVANDADGEIINFFQVLQSHGEELREYLRCLPYHRALFDDLKAPPTEPPPPLERAARFFYLARSAFGGDSRGRIPRWAFAKAHDSKPRSMFNTIENDLLLVRDRLRLVYFESSPALDVIRRYDSENAVFYCDPPYLPTTRRDGNYAFEMNFEDHEDLLLTLLDVQGMVALSGYPSDLYSDLLRDWEFVDVAHSCKINNNFDISNESRQRIERVWMNPRLADDYQRRNSRKQATLFDFDEPRPPIPKPPPGLSTADLQLGLML